MSSTSDFLTADIAQVSDGDKGDITVSGGGTVWNVDVDADSQTFTQNTPLSTWTFNHTLGRVPGVQIQTLAGEIVEVETSATTTTATATFNAPFVGRMILS